MNLSKDSYFVKGYKNAAIYKLDDEKVYALNERAKDILEKYLNKENVKFDDEEKEFINVLKEMNILTEIVEDKSDYELRKPISKIKYAWLEITEKCNLNCVHCYGEFGKPIIRKKEILLTQQWKDVIDKLFLYGCREIQLIGGEPTVHKDFFEILEYATNKGMESIDVFTNATLINKTNIEKLKKSNCYVRVSVYGHNSEVHDKITQCPGSFEKTVNALNLLKEYKIPTKIAVVVMKENEKYVSEIREFINLIGHKYSGYDVIRPSCVNSNRNHNISDVELLKSRYNTKPEFYTSKKAFIENNFYNSCWNGKIAITAKGDIIPCIFARDEIVGNILKESFEDIKEKILEKWSITKDDINVCKDCEFRYCCHDCRPIAKGIEGSLDSKYPRCCYNPYTGIWENVKNITKEIKE